MRKPAVLGLWVTVLLLAATTAAVAGPVAPVKTKRLPQRRTPAPASVAVAPSQAPASQAPDAFVTYDDVPAQAIPLGAGTACGGGEVVRTFNVPQSFTVIDVRLGFNATTRSGATSASPSSRRPAPGSS